MWPSVTPTAWKDSCLPVNNTDSLGHNILAAVYSYIFSFFLQALTYLNSFLDFFFYTFCVFFFLHQLIFQFVDCQMKKGCLLKENLRNVGILTREIKYFNLARQLDCFLFVVIERQLLPTTYSMYEGTCLVSQIRTDALSVASGLL